MNRARHEGRIHVPGKRRSSSKFTGFALELPILSIGLSPSGPTRHGWMQLRHCEAKQSMGTHNTSNGRHRTGLDALEDRRLLSGIVEVFQHPAAPVIVTSIAPAAVEISHMSAPFAGSGMSIQPVSRGPGDWPMPGLTHDFVSFDQRAVPAGLYPTISLSQMVVIVAQTGRFAGGPPSLNPDPAPPEPDTQAQVPAPPNGDYSASDVPGHDAAAPPGPASGTFIPGTPPPLLFMGIALSRPRMDLSVLPAPHDVSGKASPDDLSANATGELNGNETSSTLGHTAAAAAPLNIPGQSVATFAVPNALVTGFVTSDADARSAAGAMGSAKGPPGSASSGAASAGRGDLSAAPASMTADGIEPSLGPQQAGSESGVKPMLNAIPTKLFLPQAAGLIADAIPFDQASLEKAVDQFFDRLEDLGVGQMVDQGRPGMIPVSLALLSTAAAVEVARRRLKSPDSGRKPSEGRGHLGSEELLGYPELPGSWSTNLT